MLSLAKHRRDLPFLRKTASILQLKKDQRHVIDILFPTNNLGGICIFKCTKDTHFQNLWSLDKNHIYKHEITSCIRYIYIENDCISITYYVLYNQRKSNMLGLCKYNSRLNKIIVESYSRK